MTSRAVSRTRQGVSMPKPISTGFGVWRRARSATAQPLVSSRPCAGPVVAMTLMT